MDETNHNRENCTACPNVTYAPISGAAYCLDCEVPVCAKSTTYCNPWDGQGLLFEYYKE